MRVISGFAVAALLATLSGLARAQAPLAAQACLGCHDQGGAGMLTLPALAGRPKADIEAAMHAFQKNERPGSIMGRVARGFTDAEIVAVAAYYANQKPSGSATPSGSVGGSAGR